VRTDDHHQGVAAAAKLGERCICGLASLVLFGIGSLAALLAPGAPRVDQAAMRTGFSFSQQQTEYMDLSYQQTYHGLMQLGPSLVRLAAYWDKMEPAPGVYDFTTLDWLIANTPPGTRVVLGLGMKAPRWPEFYLPAWLEQANDMPNHARVTDDPQLRAALPDFIQAVVERYRDSPAIAYWQVENEPLDPSGPRQWTIGSDVLAQETALVDRLDSQHRPVLLTTFVSTNPAHQFAATNPGLMNRVQSLLGMADVLGLDVYPVREHDILGKALIFRWPPFIWQQRLRSVQHAARTAGKPVWVTELQAEPWLLTQVVYLQQPPNPGIVPAETEFLTQEIRADGFPTALFWGAEYWYMRMARFEDRSWWSAAQQLVA
jgi:hypothetical protein